MRLHDGSLKRRWQRAVRRKVNSSKALRRQKPKWWKRSFSLRHPVIYIPLILVILVALLTSDPQKSPAWIVCALAIYCTATAVGRSVQLRAHLTSSAERTLFFFYPVSDADFFRWTLQRFLFKSLLIWCLASIAYGVAGWPQVHWVVTAAVFAALQWLLTLCCVLALARWYARVPGWLMIPLYACVGVFFFTPPTYTKPMFQAINFLPAGWLNFLFLHFSGSAGNWVILALALCGLAAVLWRLALVFRARILADQSVVGIAESAARMLSASEGEEREDGGSAAPPQVDVRATPEWQRQRLQFVNTENVAFVHSGTWRAPLNWSAAPWLERLIGQSLTEWQKTIAEYLLAGQLPKWSDAWRTSVISAGVAAALLMLPHSPFTTFGAILAIAYSLGAAVPLVGGTWPGTGYTFVSGKFAPLHGGYPIDYLTMSLVMGKINLLRFAAWVPVGLFLGATIGWRDSGGPLVGIVFTVRILLLWIAALPLFAVGHFSKRTNDTTNLRLVTLPIFLFFGVVFGGLLVGVGIFGLAAPLLLALAAPPAIALIALAGWALYRRFYERGRVDLLSTRPR